MLRSWRKWWSSGPFSATDPVFPFGVVSLAGSTSEGHSAAMPAFRNAQTAGGGLLPSAHMPNAFVAQAFDAGEPVGGDPHNGNACERNWEEDTEGYVRSFVLLFFFQHYCSIYLVILYYFKSESESRLILISLIDYRLSLDSDGSDK